MPQPDLPPALVEDEPDWSAELDEAVFAGGPWPADERVGHWQIDSADAAEWAMRKLVAIARRVNDVRDQAKVWRDRVNVWEADELTRLQPALGFFEGHLERWALDERLKDPKRATWALPSGEVQTTKPKDPATAIVDDEATLIEWCRENLTSAEFDTVVKQVESVYVSELRKIVVCTHDGGDNPDVGWRVEHPASGTVVDGATVDFRPTTAKVKPVIL